MPLSPYRQSNVAWRLSPMERWKLAFQEIKILLLKRRYKQCATLSYELMKNLSENLHTIHKAYLQYHGAASYESLGRAAHNYSSNKLPFLNLAKDGYIACKASLEDVLKDLENEGSEPGKYSEEDLFSATDQDFDLCDKEEQEVWDLDTSAVTDAKQRRVFAVFNLTEPWRSFAKLKSRTNLERQESSHGHETKVVDVDVEPPGSDDIYEAESNIDSMSDLVPQPLRIQKTRKKKPAPKNISISNGPLVPFPLFSPPPFLPRCVPDPQTPTPSTRHPKPKLSNIPTSNFKSKIPVPVDSFEATPKKRKEYSTLQHSDTKLRPSPRMLNVLVTLPIQLASNIANLEALITQTIELQRIHKATKSHRLASFWSFTPLYPGQETVDDSKTNESNRTVSNGMETKKDRIIRLRSEGWSTVGIKDPRRGWKGSEYYERICEEALGELYGN